MPRNTVTAVRAGSTTRTTRTSTSGKTAGMECCNLWPDPGPHSHPRHHTKLVRDMRHQNPDLGMIELWHKLCLRDYTRRLESLFRGMRKPWALSVSREKTVLHISNLIYPMRKSPPPLTRQQIYGIYIIS